MGRIQNVAIAIWAVAICGWTSSKSEQGDWARQRSAYISEITRKDIPPGEDRLRDFYVAKLAGMLQGKEDEEVVALFLNLLEQEKNEWVRLEAAADLRFLIIPKAMKQKVFAALEKCRTDERINFQVLAARSILELRKKEGKIDTPAVKTLIRIAKGEKIKTWKMMVPSHNIGTMVDDPETKRQIPFEQSFKNSMRLGAIDGLAKSSDDESDAVIEALLVDNEKRVRERAKYYHDQKMQNSKTK